MKFSRVNLEEIQMKLRGNLDEIQMQFRTELTRTKTNLEISKTIQMIFDITWMQLR